MSYPDLYEAVIAQTRRDLAESCTCGPFAMRMPRPSCVRHRAVGDVLGGGCRPWLLWLCGDEDVVDKWDGLLRAIAIERADEGTGTHGEMRETSA